MKRVILSAITGSQCVFATHAYETRAYIHALATYAESKVIDSAELARIVEGCRTGQIANPFTREAAHTSTGMLLAFETLQDYIDNAELDAGPVCVWAKKAQADRQRQQQEREETGDNTAEVFEVEASILSAGYQDSCAVTSGGAVRCWPVRVDNIPLDLGEVRSVSTSTNHVCAIKGDATVQCWGDNTHGEIDVPFDLGPVRSLTSGDYHTCAVKRDGTVRCWGQNAYGQTDVPSDLGAVRSVSSGGHHTCAVTADGTVRCWGDNLLGQTKVPWDLGVVRSVSSGRGHTCAVMEDDFVRCWGGSFTCDPPDASGVSLCWPQDNIVLTLPPSDLGKVSSIACGYKHTCAVKRDGTVRCWGNNEHGEADVPSDLGVVRSVSATASRTCAAKEDGTVRCWGDNYDGQTDVPDGLCLLGFECKTPSLVERLASWWNS